MRPDVLVVGGGPAGLAAGIAARLKGCRVTVVDHACPPLDKACGEGILPLGVEALHRLGVGLSSNLAFPLQGIRFLQEEISLTARFARGCGFAIRRTALHRALVDRASQTGVCLLWGTSIASTSGLFSSRWIIGADGQNSAVRHAAGLDAGGRESRRFGFRRHYRVAPWTDFVEVHWGTRCQIYVTPVSPNEIGVALLTQDSRLRLSDALLEFPGLQEKLQGAAPSSTERGGVTISRRLRRVFHGHTALVGDASGSVDAITGEGLSLSFQQGIALAESICAGDLESYQEEHSRLARRPALFSRLLLSLDAFPAVRRTALRLLALDPSLFANLVQFGVSH